MLEQINNIYKELTYNDLNGGSIVVSVLLAIIFIGLITYFYIQINIKLLRKDWPLNRCNPLLMPFAGLIMPQSTQSAWEYTEANFSYCSMSILRKLATIATEPIHLMEEAILKMENLILEAIFAIIRLINLIKKYMIALLQSFFNKFQNIIIIQLQNGLILKDIMHRVSALMTTQYYTAISLWNTFGSAMNTMWLNIMSFFSIIFAAEYSLIGIIALMVLLYFIVLSIPIFGVAASPPFIAAAIAVATTGLIALIATIVICLLTIWIGPLINFAFDTHTPMLVPGDPTFFWRKAGLCFAKNTIIPTLHYGNIPIQHLTPGTILSDQSIVTATMILDSEGQDAFFLDNTIVTGSHKVLHNTKWIYVKDHPDAISLPPLTDPIYCFNTTNKTIQLHNTTFSDWDDIEENDLPTLNSACGTSLPSPLVFDNIHNYLEVGFHPDTSFEMKDGTTRTIGEIQLGEILVHGEIVTGCVTIQGDVPLYYHEKDVIGTANIQVDHATIKPYTGTSERLYHLLTNTGTIRRNHTLWKDYNDGLERYFEDK